MVIGVSHFTYQVEIAGGGHAPILSGARDAGDCHGINHAMRDELRGDPAALVSLRSAGMGVKRAKRYGSFIARDVGSIEEIPAVIQELATASDDVKVILTGIIDFEAGAVKGAPQFNVEELQCVIAEARLHGRKTLAHCSGAEGLKVALFAWYRLKMYSMNRV